jgi:hypothetical protein
MFFCVNKKQIAHRLERMLKKADVNGFEGAYFQVAVKGPLFLSFRVASAREGSAFSTFSAASKQDSDDNNQNTQAPGSSADVSDSSRRSRR